MPVSFPTDVAGAGCPVCEDGTLRRFYRVDRVPAMSNLLVGTSDEARRFPSATLDLASCERCGFITNLAFDESKIELSSKYEATQSHSPTFTQFARELATRWVEKFALRDKTIVEIGCGHGEFLALLAEIGGNHCIGFDPVADPLKPPTVSRGTVELINAYFDKTYPLYCDFLVCRHTLEHIARPADFMREASVAIGPRPRPKIGIEVPDTLRILRGGCFWDFFHEHCSYFTDVSLRQCLNHAGFNVTDISLEFNRQYLVAEGYRVRRIDLRFDGQPIHETAKSFANVVRPVLEDWSNRIEQWRLEGRRWAIWGAGSKAAGFLATLDVVDPVPVVDINPKKQGTFMPVTMQPVIAPELLRREKPDVVVIMNSAYEREIAASLQSLGLNPQIVALG
jgi:SAM-dependent methyltransferase